MESRQRFAELMGVAFETWPEFLKREEPSQVLLDVYWECFKPYTDEEVSNAFSIALQTLRYFPKPVEILEIIQGSGGSKAYEAWNCLIAAMGEVGAYRSVVFEDKVIHAVVETWGGWDAVCRITTEELKYKAKEFKELYNGYKNQPLHSDKLIGRAEGENILSGHPEHIEEPVYIGFRQGQLQIENKYVEPKMITEGEPDKQDLISREDLDALIEKVGKPVEKQFKDPYDKRDRTEGL